MAGRRENEERTGQGRADRESGVEVKGLGGRLVTAQEADRG